MPTLRVVEENGRKKLSSQGFCSLILLELLLQLPDQALLEKIKERQHGTLKLPYVVPSGVPFSSGVPHHSSLLRKIYILFSNILQCCLHSYFLYPLPAVHMFLCFLVLFLWYMFPWHVVLSSSGPPASSPSPTSNSSAAVFSCSACTVLPSPSRKSSAEVQCQTMLDEEGRDGSENSMNLQVTHTWNPLSSCWGWLQ